MGSEEWMTQEIRVLRRHYICFGFFTGMRESFRIRKLDLFEIHNRKGDGSLLNIKKIMVA